MGKLTGDGRISRDQNTRKKIKAAMLIRRLNACASGDLELSPTQLKAIEIGLRKILPDLKAMEITGEGGGPIRTEAWTLEGVDAKGTDTE